VNGNSEWRVQRARIADAEQRPQVTQTDGDMWVTVAHQLALHGQRPASFAKEAGRANLAAGRSSFSEQRDYYEASGVARPA